MIDLERWSEIKAIVQEALDRPAEERTTYLAEACHGDDELRQEVEALLAVSSARADFFDDFQIVPLGLQTMILKEGDCIGLFRIIRQIGKGGMSTVYLAEDTEHGRPVALKTVPRRSEKALLQEKRLLAKLQHPNIAILYDSGQSKEGFGYFIMEYVEGEPITTYCETRKLSVQDRLRLFLTVCDAVSFAHRNLVVHRDIKPSNILVTKYGQPKLLDFGIAKFLPPEPSLPQLEERAYTIAFASPEQLEGEHTTTATDVYSLGVLLCVLLTGRLPYPVKSYDDLPWAIRNMEPEIPSQLALKDGASLGTDASSTPRSQSESGKLSRKLRGDLDAIVLRTLQKDADMRYQSVQELANDISRFLSDTPVTARNGSRWYRAQKFWLRHHWSIAGASLIFSALLILSLFLFRESREATHQRDLAEQQAQQAEEITRFLIDLFDRSSPWSEGGPTQTPEQLVDAATLRLRNDLLNQPQLRARLLAALSEIHIRLGSYTKAEPLLRTALEVQRATAGKSHPITAQIYNLLGALRYFQGNSTESNRFYQMALAIARANPEVRPEDVAVYLTNLSRLRYTQGAFKESEALAREALIVYARSQKKDTPGYDATLGRLASALRKQDRFVEAEATAREVLKLRDRIFGRQHPSTALALNDLAGTLLDQKRYAEAASLYREALAILEHTLPPTHPEIATTMTNLGGTLANLGDLQESELLQRKALQIRQQAFGRHHSLVANSLNNLAFTLAKQPHRLSDAEALFRESLALKEEIYGQEHPDVIATLKNLAATLRMEKRYHEADVLFRDTLTRSIHVSGETSVSTAQIRRSYALLLLDMNDYRHAHQLAAESLSAVRQKFPETSAEVLLCQDALGASLTGLGRYREAESILLQAFHSADTHEEILSSTREAILKHLVLLYQSWSKPIQAEKYRTYLSR